MNEVAGKMLIGREILAQVLQLHMQAFMGIKMSIKHNSTEALKVAAERINEAHDVLLSALGVDMTPEAEKKAQKKAKKIKVDDAA